MAGAQAQAQAAVAKQTEYSKAHGVPKLFENLTAAIVYARPADLNAFLAAEVERVAAEGAAYSPFPAHATVQTEEAAAAYLEAHGVERRLGELLARVLVARPPGGPLPFLAAAARAAGGGAPDAYFSDDDLRGVHALHDPTTNGFVTAAGARAALRAVGVPAPAAGAEALPERVTAEEFVVVARRLLAPPAPPAPPAA